MGIDPDVKKEVPGMWVGVNENAKYWVSVLKGLKNRGAEDIFIVRIDNLTEFSAAIGEVYPCTPKKPVLLQDRLFSVNFICKRLRQIRASFILPHY